MTSGFPDAQSSEKPETITEHGSASRRLPLDPFIWVSALVALTVVLFVHPRTNLLPYGLTVDGMDLGGKMLTEAQEALEKRARAVVSRTFIINGPEGWSKKVELGDLGVRVDVSFPMKRIRSLLREHSSYWGRVLLSEWAREGRLHFSSVLQYDRGRVQALFADIKNRLDRKARSARVDLVNRRVVPGTDGIVVDVARSIASFESVITSGKSSMKLVFRKVRPSITNSDLRGLSLQKVLGWYETSFAFRGKYANRAHNLRVGASKLTGAVLLPGREWSFNQALGPRTAEEGYRMAPIIARGEMVDGMAGGMCQIASTLHAAAFFAGLDIVQAKNHTQPSHYIDLGLDATVVYPSVDMVLRNPYPFPVVIRYDVRDGRVRVEILGRERPYAKIGFERRIIEERPFKTEYREDPELIKGIMKLAQRGQKGYLIRRRRIFFDQDGYEVKAQRWTLYYPPTTMIIRVGTKEPDDPAWQPPEPPEFTPRKDPPAFRREIQ